MLKGTHWNIIRFLFCYKSIGISSKANTLTIVTGNFFYLGFLVLTPAQVS